MTAICLPSRVEVPQRPPALDADLLGVALQRGPVPVGIAEDEPAGLAGEVVQHPLGADVAAVDEVAGPRLLEHAHGLGHRLDPVVRVAEDPDQHRRRLTGAGIGRNMPPTPSVLRETVIPTELRSEGSRAGRTPFTVPRSLRAEPVRDDGGVGQEPLALSPNAV